MTSHPNDITSAQTQTMYLSDETPDQDGQAGASGARKRKRAHYSCVECSKRKAKCDRSLPCAGCVSRRIPGLCKYLVAGYEDPLKQTEEIKSRLDRNIEISEDVRERLSRLEGLFVQQQQQQQQQQRQQQQQAPTSHFIPLQFPPEQPLCIPGPSRQQQPYERSDLRRASLREEDVEEPPGLKGRITEGSFFGTSAMATVEQPGLLDHGDQGNTSGTMGSDFRWREIIRDLPRRVDVEILLDHYFVAINLTRCPVREIPFMASQQQLFDNSENLGPSDQVFLPLLLIVLAISRLNCSDPKLDHADARLHPDNLYSASRRASALVEGLAKAPVSLDRVMTDFLTARYLILVRRASDAYVVLGAAIARAQSQGLHRDSNGLEFVLDLVQEEDRRRVWQYIYHLDRYLGLLVGRPHQIQDEDCDALPPSTDVSQPHVSWGFTCGLEDVESTLRFILLRTRMAKIMARLSKEAFGIRPAGFEKTLELDRVLVDWADGLPRDFQILSRGHARETQGQVDLHSTHRFLLSAEYNYARITLHRPFLLLSVREPGEITGQRYKESLEACYQSAMDDLWARSIYAQQGMGKLSGGTYRITTCAVILGVIMLVDPARERLKTIRDCLQAFTRARREGEWLDEVGIQGFALLELIQARAESGVIGTPDGPGVAGMATGPAISVGQEQTYGSERDMHRFEAAPSSLSGIYAEQRGLISNPTKLSGSNATTETWPVPQAFDGQEPVDNNPTVFPWAGDFSSSDYELFEALMAHFNAT